MPTYQHQIDKHLLFPIERRGDTLIVTPKGDPGSFANLNFNLEHAALMDLLKTGPYRNLLVDLSGSNYFGAKVLGAIAEWSKRIAEREGQVAVCGVSSDMQELLHIYGFEAQWKQYPTREKGIKAIVKESSLQSLKRQWKVGLFALLLLAGVGVGYWLRPYFTDHFKNERDYQTIMGVWEEMQALKAANAPSVEWRKLKGRANREFEPILKDLHDRAGSETPEEQAAQCMWHASQNYILNRFLVDLDRMDLDVPIDPKHEVHWETTGVFLLKARRLLDGEDASDVVFPHEVDAKPQDAAEAVPLVDGPPNPNAPDPKPMEPNLPNPDKTPMDESALPKESTESKLLEEH